MSRNDHHQINNFKAAPQFSLLRHVLGNLSEYKHPSILILIIFGCRNFNAKDADNNRKRRCLKDWLIFAGIMLTVITLIAMIMNIYLLIIIIPTPTTTTTTTGENRVRF
jgi:hypothetical protein